MEKTFLIFHEDYMGDENKPIKAYDAEDALKPKPKAKIPTKQPVHFDPEF